MLVTSPVISLTAPMVIDSEGGRLYITGVVDGVEQIVALAATDGRLLATYGVTGTFDIDPIHGWLYVDQAKTGLLVLNAETGILHTTVPLPADTNTRWRSEWAPQADPTTNRVLAFRENAVYIIDPIQGRGVDTIVFDIPSMFGGQETGEQGLLRWTEYDDSRCLLYLDFKTHFNPSFMINDNDTIIAYDMDNRVEISRVIVGSTIKATAVNGYLYGADWDDAWTHWIWLNGKPLQKSCLWWHRRALDNLAFYVDSSRDRLYESSGGLRVVDAKTMALLISIPSPVEGRLLGYDPMTDQLHFVSDGRLYTWPAGAIQPPSPEPLEISEPPTASVQALLVSPAWSKAKDIFGLWGYDNVGCDYTGFGSLLYASQDSGSTWGHLQGGLRGTCGRVSAVAISPNYANDKAVLAGVVGMGIFKSSDGGQWWQPSSAGIPDMVIFQILFSPDFEHDQTVYARTFWALYRSTDGGASWQSLDTDLDCVDISPRFEQDQTLIGIAPSGNTVLISQDRGDTWNQASTAPGEYPLREISIMPGSGERQTVFVHDYDSLYRSTDGGHKWKTVLTLEQSQLHPSRIVYGAQAEGETSAFLLLTGWYWENDTTLRVGTVYHSEDGESWQEVEMPPGITPTALAISPAFAEDGLLFIGTEDGRVVTLDARE
jgi:hypothetical protein